MDTQTYKIYKKLQGIDEEVIFYLWDRWNNKISDRNVCLRVCTLKGETTYIKKDIHTCTDRYNQLTETNIKYKNNNKDFLLPFLSKEK